MSDRRELIHPESLPPRDVWLIDPTQDKLPTPLDQYGLIDVPRLITDVKSTIDADYEWPTQTRIHHLYWEENNYPFIPGVPPGYNPRTFRELPINKAEIPLKFERWLHAITLEPKVPDPEIMRLRVLAFHHARLIFKKAHGTVHEDRLLQKRRRQVAANPGISKNIVDGIDIASEAYFAETVDRAFDALLGHLDEYHSIPEEHRLIKETDAPQDIATKLGKLVVPPAQKYTLVVAA